MNNDRLVFHTRGNMLENSQGTLGKSLKKKESMESDKDIGIKSI